MEQMDPRTLPAQWLTIPPYREQNPWAWIQRLILITNDAYPFFQKLGDLLITGPTQTNVMDVRILFGRLIIFIQTERNKTMYEITVTSQFSGAHRLRLPSWKMRRTPWPQLEVEVSVVFQPM